MEKENEITGVENTTAQEAAVQQEAAGSGEDRNPNAEDFKSMRGALKDMKGENSILRNELLQVRQAITQPQQKEVDPFEGRDGTDYLTIDDQKQRENAMRAEYARDRNVLERNNQASSFLTSTPDYNKIMEDYGKQLPIELRTFLAKNPNDPDALKAAYAACKNSAAHYRNSMSGAEHDNSKRMAENMSKPGAGSSAGSGGTLSMANKLKNMTSTERIEWSDECIRNG